MRPANVPRTARGTRSGNTAVSGPCAKLKPMMMHTHATVKDTKVLANDIPISDIPPTSAPSTIHGARLPKRLRVRSDNSPATGCDSIEMIPPMVVTMARFAILSASPRDCCTCRASRTEGTEPQTRLITNVAEGNPMRSRRSGPRICTGPSVVPSTTPPATGPGAAGRSDGSEGVFGAMVMATSSLLGGRKGNSAVHCFVDNSTVNGFYPQVLVW